MKFHRDDIIDKLFTISPDCPRDEWWRYLAGLKTEYGEDGKEPALQWSMGSDKFNNLDFESTWASLEPGHISGGTIVHAAGGSTSSNTYTPRNHVAAIPNKKDTARYAKSLVAAANYSDLYVSEHPYWQRKLAPLRERGLLVTSAFGGGRGFASGRVIGQRQDCLIIPLRDLETDQCVGCEVINPAGAKQTFGKKGVVVLGNSLDKSVRIYITEGWADAVSAWGYYSRDGSDIMVVSTLGKAKQQSTAETFDAQGRDVIVILDGVKKS